MGLVCTAGEAGIPRSMSKIIVAGTEHATWQNVRLVALTLSASEMACAALSLVEEKIR